MYSTFSTASHNITLNLQRKATKVDISETSRRIVDLQMNQKALTSTITELEHQIAGATDANAAAIAALEQKVGTGNVDSNSRLIADNAVVIEALERKVGTGEVPGGAVGRDDVAGLILTDTTVTTLRTDVNNHTSAINALELKVGTAEVPGGVVGRDDVAGLISTNTTVTTLRTEVNNHTSAINA